MRAIVKDRFRFVLGLICAPLVGVYSIPVLNCASTLFREVSNCRIGLGGFTWIGLPSAAIAMTIAIPLIVLALRHGWTRIHHFAVSGICIALALSASLAFFDPTLNFFAVALAFAPIGCATATVFWLIGVSRNVTRTR